jgi:hypothetical protein
MIGRFLPLVVALTLMTPAIAAGGDEPAAYAERVPVTPTGGSPVQRLDLPASVLVAARSPDLADVRVFNAQGQAVPIARSAARAPHQQQNTALPVLPIMGAADALTVTGVSLRIDERQRAHVVRVDGTPQQSGESQLLGILLDTRRIQGPVSAISLDVATPAAQPVTFTIESSADLKDWQSVADKVIYRTSGEIGRTSIGFPRRDLDGSYLRVTWRAASRLLAPVNVKAAAAVTTHRGTAPMPRVQLIVPPSAGRHVIDFTLPFAAQVAALEIEPAGGDTVLSIRIFGRNQSEEPWTPVASGSLFRVTSDGQTRFNPAFDMHGTRFRTLRIEADKRSDGFEAAPKIAVRLQPSQLVFLASGSSPFTLAAGRADAQAVFLPLSELTKASGLQVTADLPTATITAAPDPVVQVSASQQGTPWGRITLWLVLLAGTALLAGMVWLLMRRREPVGVT